MTTERDNSAKFLTYGFSHQKYPPGLLIHTLKSFRFLLQLREVIGMMHDAAGSQTIIVTAPRV